MRQFYKLGFVLCGTFSFLGMVYAAVVPNNDDPITFLGPTARLGLTQTITENTAYSIAGEAAPKNFRIGGTLGWDITDNQRLKFSAEYLWQDITYSFVTGNVNKWVNQGAIGAAYQYDLGCMLDPKLNLSAYGSHAPNHSLSTIDESFINSDGSSTPFSVDRRIAGSNAGGIMPSVSILPWLGGRLMAGLNYDYVHYDKKYSSDENVSGLGGTIGFDQAITNRIGFGVGAEIRQPFNNYTANLSWTTLPDCDNWSLALFGNYLVGKEELPNSWNIGLSVNYLIDTRQPQTVTVRRGRDLKGEVPVTLPVRDRLLSWTADPAVYMPTVLAVPDQRLTSLCTAGNLPRVLSPLPNFINQDYISDTNRHVFNSPTHFAGINLHYSFKGSVVFAAPNNPIPASSVFVLDEQTGALVLPANTIISDTEYAITITATSECGSASTTFLIEIDNT